MLSRKKQNTQKTFLRSIFKGDAIVFLVMQSLLRLVGSSRQYSISHIVSVLNLLGNSVKLRYKRAAIFLQVFHCNRKEINIY